jgi:hypothetical protein
MKESQQQFSQDKYLILEQFADKALLSVICQYLWFRSNNGNLSKETTINASRLSHEPVLDVVLEYFAVLLGKATGLKLVPSYSFARIYHQGADLFRHVDRPACEISCTLPLGYSANGDWPIFVTTDEQDLQGRAVNLDVGDVLLYRGEQVWHWRDGLSKQWQAQIFLHFVDADGDNTQWQCDKRGKLSMSLKQLFIGEDMDADQELKSAEVAKELTAFLQKQLMVLKVLQIIKKSVIPVVIAVATVAAWYFVG